MKNRKVFCLQTADGVYLGCNTDLGCYFGYSRDPKCALHFPNYLLASTFALGYNTTAGVFNGNKVAPVLIEL